MGVHLSQFGKDGETDVKVQNFQNTAPVKNTSAQDDDFDEEDELGGGKEKFDMFGGGPELEAQFDKLVIGEEVEDDLDLNEIDNILELTEDKYPKFTLAKNKARFLRMVSHYRAKEEWIDVAPLSGVTKTFKQETKQLETIRADKMDYEMELETGTLTPSQRSYRKDELKMCRVHEKMAVHLISKLQLKIKSGRR
jgi:hypothetical protein